MLTVYLDCGANDRHLALTLSELVPGAIEGIVRQVVLIDRGMSAESRSIADQCGCETISANELAAKFEDDSSPWMLWLEAGSRFRPGWTEDVRDHIGAGNGPSGGPQAARFSPSAKDRPGFLSRLRSGRSALTDGLVVKKPQAVGLLRQRGEVPLADLAKGLATTRLKAEIRPKRAAD